jgi:hypothetical protein
VAIEGQSIEMLLMRGNKVYSTPIVFAVGPIATLWVCGNMYHWQRWVHGGCLYYVLQHCIGDYLFDLTFYGCHT